MTPIKLGELIQKLEKCDPTMNVIFDWPATYIPTDVHSYRGYYKDLAIGYISDENHMTCEELIELLRSCIDRVFEGYKGGEYRMTKESYVWAANYGSSMNLGIVDVDGGDFNVILETRYIPYYKYSGD